MPYKNIEDRRAASQRYYQRNRAAMIARAIDHRRATRQKITEVIRERKAVPCADCGERYPYYVMQFDHLGDKSFSIGRYRTRTEGTTVTEVVAEIAKCEVVCANCHAERTHQRGLVAGTRFERATSGL